MTIADALRHPMHSVLVTAAAVGLGCGIGFSGCASLPPGAAYPKQPSIAFAEPATTDIGQRFDRANRTHPGDSGFRILSVGVDGFAARMQLIAGAERSLDLQYFIFRADNTGRLLANALLAAADRGVHVRLLLDDGDTNSGDELIATLAAHPQIEIRVYNPFVYRGHSMLLRSMEYSFNHGRLDYRMHNKLFVVDNAAALIGGRNIADAYFQVDADAQYADDDVFVTGAAVAQLSASFDEFWNSAMAIPVEALAGGRPALVALTATRQRLALELQQAQASGVSYLQRASGGEPFNGIESGQLPLVWSIAKVVSDSPSKKRVTDGSMVGRLMYEPVAAAATATQSELLMITPYFVPTATEMKLLLALRARHVRVRILTNSLASTNAWAAHSAYERFRLPLLRAGVELYEVRAQLGKSSRGSGQTAAMSRHGNYGLHAKLFVFDQQSLFIGSMNFDQRSARLNTEIGLIIGSPELAQQSAVRFEAMVQPASAYEVVLVPDAAGRQRLQWHTLENNQPVVYAREPSPSVWRRMVVRLLSLFPLDDEL